MSKEKTAEWRGGHEPFRQTRQLLICFSVIRVFGGHILIEETRMSRPTTESKRLLSHTIAEWACATEIRRSFAGGDSGSEIILV